MSELKIGGGYWQTRLKPSELRRISELGYSEQDIKDLGVTKVRGLIQSGTVKEGETDQAIARREAQELKIKTRATRTRDVNQNHVTDWLAKLEKKGINVSESTLREAINSGDAAKYLGSKGISYGDGRTSTIPWGVLRSMEYVVNYENKYESPKKPEVETPKYSEQQINTLSIIHGKNFNKSIEEQKEINNVTTKVNAQEAVNNNPLKIVQ